MRMRVHRVASAAYQQVDNRQNCPENEKKKYGALAHKLPGMILQNGLAQATGFLLAKGGNNNADPHSMLLDDLSTVLRHIGALNAAHDNGDAHRPALRQAFHADILNADLPRTLMLTRHTLEVSGWIKRYVQGLLRIDATGETVHPQENH